MAEASDAMQAHARSLPIDTTITASDQVTVKGQTVPYTVTTGTQPAYGEDGNPIASLFYTYYERSDVDDRTRRPPSLTRAWTRFAHVTLTTCSG